MTIKQALFQDVQKSDLGKYVVMYEVDCTPIGGSVLRFIPTIDADGTTVLFNGKEYFPMNIKADGFEYQSSGTMARPTLSVGNVMPLSSAITAGVVSLNDLLGAVVTRRRTLEKYLDGRAEATPPNSPEFSPDVYVVERKVSQEKHSITFELSAFNDFEGKMIPGRLVLRDSCTHKYRIYDPANASDPFNYANVTCPYVAQRYYNANGVLITYAQEDNCGRKLSDCKLRFPNDTLPTRAFPGIGRVR